MAEQEHTSIDEKATMTNSNPFQNQGDQAQEDAENQPALRMPRVDRQRDAGSGLTSGTAPGINSTDSYQYEGSQSIGPGSDPHGGAGDGTGITTGQFRGSDDGTTTEPHTVANPGNNQGTDLSRNQQSNADYHPGTSQKQDEDTAQKAE